MCSSQPGGTVRSGMTSKWLSVKVASVDPDLSCELPFCPPGPYVPVEGDTLTKEAEYIEPSGVVRVPGRK